MSDDSNFGQRVMAAAGVEPEGWEVPFSGTVHTSGDEAEYERIALMRRAPGLDLAACSPVYPDPLTPDGFVALWDALEARGWRVEFRTLCDGTLAQVYKADEMGRPDLASIFQGGHASRAAALLEAAAQALHVAMRPS